MAFTVSSTPTFDRSTKKLRPRDKAALDDAVKEVLKNPKIGDEKKGDLAGFFVYEFKINKQEVLLACGLMPDKFRPKEII